ncbi:MAG: hypothetical protein COA99_12000 [Moraxellaceae bacterium]|nr:MAG: hypothetical protein COA99_12000 [Moraxellaceae bacterium]
MFLLLLGKPCYSLLFSLHINAKNIICLRIKQKDWFVLVRYQAAKEAKEAKEAVCKLSRRIVTTVLITR